MLFAEHARLLHRGGRYVTITGCYNDTYGRASREVALINAHYICDIHPRSEYFRAMARNRLVPVHVEDLTTATIPHWELRKQADHLVTGIEDTFLTAYWNSSFQYLLIATGVVSGWHRHGLRTVDGGGRRTVASSAGRAGDAAWDGDKRSDERSTDDGRRMTA